MLKFDQYLQGELSTKIIVDTLKEIIEKEPDITRAKLIIKATKELRGRTNSAQIAKVIKKIKGKMSNV